MYADCGKLPHIPEHGDVNIYSTLGKGMMLHNAQNEEVERCYPSHCD